MTRPKRRAIPLKAKRAVVERQGGICLCGCGAKVEAVKHAKTTRFDHTPAIFLRLVNDAGTDYIPPQSDPAYIVARCVASDKLKTYRQSRSTTAGADSNAFAKQRRRDRGPKKFKRKIASRGFQKGQRKMLSRPFQKRIKR